jgi:hypothetical protein
MGKAKNSYISRIEVRTSRVGCYKENPSILMSYSRDVQARYVAPCTATSPSAFRIVLGSFNTSKTFFRICSFFSPCWLAICERVLYLDQIPSSLSQTTHSTLSSPMGRENFGRLSVKVPCSECKGVEYCWSSKTCRQVRCLNRGWPSSISVTISFSSCSHFVAVFHDCAPLSKAVKPYPLQGVAITYSLLCSKSCQKQLLAV